MHSHPVTALALTSGFLQPAVKRPEAPSDEDTITRGWGGANPAAPSQPWGVIETPATRHVKFVCLAPDCEMTSQPVATVERCSLVFVGWQTMEFHMCVCECVCVYVRAKTKSPPCSVPTYVKMRLSRSRLRDD